jgi:hypothetical protein
LAKARPKLKLRKYRLRTSLQTKNGHRLVRKLFAIMHENQMGVLDMAERSGVNKNTLKDWRTRTTPRLKDIEACYEVLGYELIARRARSTSSAG